MHALFFPHIIELQRFGHLGNTVSCNGCFNYSMAVFELCSPSKSATVPFMGSHTTEFQQGVSVRKRKLIAANLARKNVN